MSILSTGLKKLRKAAGLPAITLGNVAKAVAPAIPIPGVGVAVNALVNKASTPNFVDTLKASVNSKAEEIGQNIGVALEARQNVQQLTAAAQTPVPLWLIGGAVALLLLSRK